MKFRVLVPIGMLCLNTACSWSDDVSDLHVYAPVPGLAPSDHYVVRVRTASNSTAWHDVFAWQTTCGTNSETDAYFSSLADWSHTYVNFAATVPVVVEISNVDGTTITKAAIHPAREGSVTISDGKAYVTLSSNCNVAVDINGQMDGNDTGFVVAGTNAFFGHAWQGPPIHTLSIHNNPPLEGVPSTNDPSVYLVRPGTTPPPTGTWSTLYFLPGVHNIGISFPIHANKRYYIPGDALVYGGFCNTNWFDGRNIRIFGHGTLSQTGWPNPKYIADANASTYDPVLISGAMQSRVEGITIADPCHHSVMMPAGNDLAQSPLSSWVKVFGWRANGDGINPFGNGRIEHCFLRTQDDSCYVNGAGISDTVFWNDANGSAFVLSSLPQLTNRTLIVRDCDVIYARAKWIYWGGGRVFNMRGEGGGNCGSGIVFSNINIEDPRPTMQTFFGCMTVPDPYGTNTRGSGDWSGTIFKNVSIAATNRNAEQEILWGAENAQIHDLTFDNLTVGGSRILSNIFLTNSYVYNLHFIDSSPMKLSEVSTENDRFSSGISDEAEITYPYSFKYEGNPLVRHISATDPDVHVWDGVVWMYCSQDHQKREGDNGNYDSMDGYHVFSSTDLVHWTDHGEIMHSRNIAWGLDGWLWAPGAARKDGKYYLYYPHKDKKGEWRIGVAIGDAPAGPFKDIEHPIEGTSGIDPAIFIDDDGQAYIYFGIAMVAKLKPNMVELAETPRKIDYAPTDVVNDEVRQLREGAYMHMRNGIYYYSYTNYRNEEYQGFYAMGKSPYGPFEWKGAMAPKPRYAQYHHSVIEFKGQWYDFYHVGGKAYKPAGYKGSRRIACFDKLYCNLDGTIRMVEHTSGK